MGITFTLFIRFLGNEWTVVVIKEPKGIHDIIKCLFFSKNFGKTSVQPRT